MKLWLKKLTSAVTVFTLSASVVAVNATAVKAEDGDLGYFNGQPIVSITNLTAEKQEDAANAEEKALLALTGGDTVTAIVELEKACVIDAGLKPGTPEGKAYASELKVEQETVNNTIKSTYAELIEKGNKTSGLKREIPALDVKQSYVNVMNGFAVEVPYKALPIIREMKGVKNVFVSREYKLPETEVEPEMYTSTSMISSNIANQSGFSGEGTVVGVLDTGLDVAHEAFANAPADAKITEAIDGTYLNATGTTYFSEKVPFAYDYADKDNDVYPLRSDHGNHVAGTVAAKTVDAEGNVTFSGVAPEAQLAIFKVFSEKQNGARDEWILSALEDVVVIQPDVINLSLGSPAGFSSELYTGETTMEDVYNRVYQNGTVLAISAGNEDYMGSNHLDGSGMPDAENPNTGIVGSPSTYSGPTSVASIENYQLITDYFVVDGHTIMYSDTAESEEQMFSSLGDQAPLSYVLVPGYGEAADYEGLDVTGKIAVVSRGSTTFVSKQLTAAEMGAVAIIIYNNQPGTISMQIEKNTIPAIAITLADAQYLINSETMEIAELGHAGKFVNDQGWQMSDFSSWGVTEDLKLKPEVTAPGGHIYSALPGNKYGDKSGTSMAAPHMAGLAALATQWVDKLYGNQLNELQKADITNALIMSTATPVPYGNSEDLFYSPRKQGAGLIDIADTISSLAYLTVDGTAGNRPKIELGDDPAKSGFYRLSFTVNNWSRYNLGYSVKVYVQSDEVVDGKITTAPVALDAIVEGEETVTVGGGASRRINLAVTLTDSAKEYLDSNYPNGGFVDGFVVLEADGAVLTEEGLGNFVDLSIPFVGFYGNWDDAPMLDETLENVENAKIAGTGASTVFGYVNYYQPTQGLVWPFIGQNAYDPEWDYFAKNVPAQHNTISSDSYYRIYVDYLGPSYLPYLAEDDEKNTGIWYLTPALLRNASWWSVDIKDADTGEAYYHDELSENLGKYYTRTDGVISGGMIYLGWGAYNQYSDTYEALPEGTNVELTLSVARDQNSRVESQKMYFTIDNSEPEIVGYEDGNTPVQVYELADGSRYLIFTARDNYYLADYEVYDEEDNLIGFDYFYDEAAGTENVGFADITDYDEDAEFTVILHDYTEYQTTYKISATADMVITPDNKSAAVGSDVSFTLSDTNGFEIDEAEAEWTVEGAESESTKIEAGVLTIGEDETASTLTVKALYGEMEAAAVVTVLHYYNVELIIGDYGTATLSEEGKVLETTNVIVTATPDDTHILDQILVNGEPVEADSNGKASFIVEGDTTVEVTFKEYPDLIINELTYTAPVVLGYESVLTAESEGGKAPYEYKFTVKTDNGWVTARDFSSDAEWHWTPEQFGDVRVAVYVKDARGVQAKKLFYVPVDETLPPVTLEIDAPKTVEIGETVTITGTGSGGAKPLQYKLSRKDGDTWVTVENYSEKNEFSWTPETVGSYRFAVYVKDAENTQVKKLVTIKVVEPLTLSVEIPSAAVVGEPVSIKGIGSGGTEPLQYKMALKDGDTWTTFSDYTDSGEFTWTPEAAGTYRIAVYVKDADNVQKKELHKITVTEAN